MGKLSTDLRDKRKSTDLSKIEIPLDEPKGKLFPRPKKAKSNFSETITQKHLTSKHKRDKLLVGRKYKTNRKKDMHKVNSTLDKLPKVISIFGLAAFALAFFVEKYQSDTTVLLLATILVSIAVITSLRK